MYRTAYQRGMLTIFYSVGSKPLEIWDVYCKDGYVSRFLDNDIKSMVLEIRGNNVSTTYMTCPSKNRTLGISMPFLVMIVKNLKKYFSFEVTILDETNTRRRFRVSNFQSSTQILPMCTAMPIGLSDGWNQIQFNLSEFTRRAYKKQFIEVQKLKINANIRLRRIYFAERLIPEDELPAEYKLFFPLPSKGAKGKKDEKKLAAAQVAPAAAEKTELVKPPSKASIHSLKKTPSKAGSTAKIEAAPADAQAEAPPAGEAVTETTGEATPAPGEETPVTGEATPAENAAENQPAEEPAEAPAEDAPAEAAPAE
ncbi:hypothetical protein MSG28_008586 [Choristoneura fumiferana]|uniref:Uncharacterized protein n=1 Tax=Choristoneura fumiferana TaxID=7141 RepID=A0ACC0J7B7_CHOFU|nr:hypothetical protein MSG28_008586 [Choristoneura fumiferana]